MDQLDSASWPKRTMEMVGIPVSMREAKFVIKMADREGDGELCYDEFVDFVLGADPHPNGSGTEETETGRDLPAPSISVGGLDIPLPKPEVAVTSATTAAVTTVAALFSVMLIQQLKRALTPLAKELVRDKKGKKKKKK